MPYLGLGVFKAKEGPDTENAVRWALEAGYRHIDTATLYRNENSVGNAVRQSGIPREEIFITTKLWNGDQLADNIIEAFEESLRKLQTEYIDLYLVHFPIEGKINTTWKKMEEIYQSGKARAIGVSNFQKHHLKELLREADIIPSVNQMECHPYLVKQDLQDYCQELGIRYEAWRPVMNGKVNKVPLLRKLAKKYGKNPAQIALRWQLQKGIVTIPKSVHKERIISNGNLFDFELSSEDISRIDALDRNKEIRAYPLFLRYLYRSFKRLANIK
jgi:diketogulonate reductase-like aldo/keto reductase